MPKWIGNRFGSVVPVSGNGAGPAIYSLFDQYYASREGGWTSTALIATGGTQSGPGGVGTALEPGDGYKYHIFTATANPGLQVTQAGHGEVEYLIVGGGGGGGRRTGGGGGAGGFRTGTSTGLTATSYPIVVGAAGAGTPWPSPPPTQGGIGGFSTFNSIRSEGGGGGNGGPGASGGGGSYTSPTAGVGNREAGTTTPVPSQGNPGGIGGQPSPGYNPSWGGGGGGAGQAAPDTPSNDYRGGIGGNGLAAFSGTTGLPSDYGTPGASAGRWFAGGGGGGGSYLPGAGEVGGTGGAGGSGGGGGGNPDEVSVQAPNGAQNTGGGGGGGSIAPPGGADARDGGGVGGSGIVIIRYLV